MVTDVSCIRSVHCGLEAPMFGAKKVEVNVFSLGKRRGREVMVQGPSCVVWNPGIRRWQQTVR